MTQKSRSTKRSSASSFHGKWGTLFSQTQNGTYPITRHAVKATAFKANDKAKDLTSKAKDLTTKAKVKDWTYKAKDETALMPSLVDVTITIQPTFIILIQST